MHEAVRAPVLYAVAFLVQGGLGVGWWWLAPHRFPVTTRPFWLHDVLPVVLLTLSLLTLRWPGARVVLAGLWAGLATAMLGLFRAEALLFVAFASMWGALDVAMAWEHRDRRLAGLGLLIGCGGAWAMGAGPSGTTPIPGVVLDDLPGPARHVAHHGAVDVHVVPHLQVLDASRHGFQTLFGPRPDPVPARMVVKKGEGSTTIVAASELETERFAHLSPYSQVGVGPVEEPVLRLEPCGDVPIAVRPRDYPFGMPVRVAVVDAERRFRVVEASSAEKGPYTTLCEGHLGPDDALVVEVHDGDVPRVRIEWLDYARQLSTRPSPAAGWGMPENALLFWRDGDGVVLVPSLASTGTGIGWASATLSAGVYRNRMVITDL